MRGARAKQLRRMSKYKKTTGSGFGDMTMYAAAVVKKEGIDKLSLLNKEKLTYRWAKLEYRRFKKERK